LRVDEARRWLVTAVALADGGEAGAVAALLALVMGMRATEIVSRVVRDLDDDGKLLWIPDSKTEAGRRTLQVPELLQPFLKGLAEGKSLEAKLFGHHWRDWVRKWVKRICEAAGVPKVTAHGMRGCISTLAVENGVSAHVVAASLGHESSATTIQSYVKPEAVAGAQQRRVMTVLEGGRLAS
jgi:integrase